MIFEKQLTDCLGDIKAVTFLCKNCCSNISVLRAVEVDIPYECWQAG